MSKDDKTARRFIPDQTAMETFLTHGRHFTEKWEFKHHIIPPQSSSVTYRLDRISRAAQGFGQFAQGEGSKQEPIYIYDRLDEPTRGMLEDELAAVEGGDFCVAFATGMAAISAALGVSVKPGEEVIAHKTMYGCTHSLLTGWYPNRLNIQTHLIDLRSLEELEATITPKTRVVYFETPINPTMELLDIAAIRAVVDRANEGREPDQQIRVIVDNTFATPYCQRPLELGAHISVQSLTKNVGGYGTDMGGSVTGPAELEGEVLLYRKDFGGALAPKSAWPILVYGLPTLPMRLTRQMETAREVAKFLRSHPKVSRVVYPGLEDHPQYELAKKQLVDPQGRFAPGNMIAFEVAEAAPGAQDNTVKVLDWIGEKAYTLTLAVSLGQLRTLVDSPGAMTHAVVPEEDRAKGGIAPNGIRLSIGIESAEDIIRDLDAALNVAG